VIFGWAHVAQSITKLITTELAARLERRDLVSPIPGLIDAPQNEETILAFYLAIAETLEPRRVRNSIYGEPRFDLTAVNLNAKVPGAVSVSLQGDYYPDGHKTATSRSQPMTLAISVPAVPLN